MKRWTIGIGVVALAVYVVVWWMLVFTGYYDDKMSPEMVRHSKTFLPADLFLFANFAGFFLGLRGKKPWAYACGFVICGAVTYMCIHGITAMIAGTLPTDVATQLIFLPYLVGAVVGWFLLCRDVESSGSSSLNGGHR